MPTNNGRTALVTGGSRGIGKAAALALAASGAQVLVHYGKDAAAAADVVAEIEKGGGKAKAIGADLAEAEGPRELAAGVRQIVGDRLDILVANAGIASATPFEDTKIEEFDRLFAVNVRAPFFLVQHLLPILGQGSSVIFTSSLAARGVVGQLAAYAASKGAIDTLVRPLAVALGPRGIRVNAVAPGIVATDMSNFAKTEEGRDYAYGIQALRHVGQPDDIAGAFAFLASSDAGWITGTTLSVDGGAKL